MHVQPIPTPGLCECGCGQPAPIASHTTARWVKGQPKRFITGHNARLQTKAFEEQFHVEPSGCWGWHGSQDKDGYGMFSLKGLTRRAHRVAYETANGPIPAGLLVCHHCDNPPCVNPAHLFLGTPADNTADMDAKGRGRRTRTEWKLTAESAAEIKRRYTQGGISQKALATQYGVSQTMVWRILKGKAWASVPTS